MAFEQPILSEHNDQQYVYAVLRQRVYANILQHSISQRSDKSVRCIY
jgi:hypothetical protein